MKALYKNILLVLGIAILIASCEKEPLTAFKADSAINFTTDSLTYSFLGNNSGEYMVEIPVRISGNSVEYDREFSVEVLGDNLTTASDDLYEIIGGEIPANKFNGSLRVKVFNREQLDDQEASLHLKITGSEDFVIGNKESNDYVLKWTNKVVVPNWRYFSFFFTRYSSTKAYLLFVEITGLTDFTSSDYRAIGPTGAAALGKAYGDYIRKYNSEHLGEPLTHDDGDHAGEEIIPIN